MDNKVISENIYTQKTDIIMEIGCNFCGANGESRQLAGKPTNNNGQISTFKRDICLKNDIHIMEIARIFVGQRA